MAYNTTIGFQMLQNGSWTASVGYLYEGVMSYWFWLLILVGVLILVYINTQSEVTVGIFGIIGSLAFTRFLPPSVHPILYFITVVSIALTLYKLWKP